MLLYLHIWQLLHDTTQLGIEQMSIIKTTNYFNKNHPHYRKCWKWHLSVYISETFLQSGHHLSKLCLGNIINSLKVIFFNPSSIWGLICRLCSLNCPRAVRFGDWDGHKIQLSLVKHVTHSFHRNIGSLSSGRILLEE